MGGLRTFRWRFSIFRVFWECGGGHGMVWRTKIDGAMEKGVEYSWIQGVLVQA